jgi:hypothetical protein
MKKLSVPETSGQSTPEYIRAVKDNLEVMAGRRKNKIDLPDIQTLTFSSPPTQAECQALNAYINEWTKSVRALTARFDD